MTNWSEGIRVRRRSLKLRPGEEAEEVEVGRVEESWREGSENQTSRREGGR